MFIKKGSGEHFTFLHSSIGQGNGFYFDYGNQYGDGYGNGVYSVASNFSIGGAGHSYGFQHGDGKGENYMGRFNCDKSYPYELLLFNL